MASPWPVLAVPNGVKRSEMGDFGVRWLEHLRQWLALSGPSSRTRCLEPPGATRRALRKVQEPRSGTAKGAL